MKNPQHNLESENNEPSNNEGWAQVTHRKRKLVGGTETSCQVETVPKLISLHVIGLKPSTEPEELRKFLEVHLEGVKCKIHLLKQPEIYASMKVFIRQEQLKSAWYR
ncbi:hypothetical protein JTB14_004289 [Gonioctena quinquepunctata]|nr:hypothetical protein JTB14_004289 [Gonioctena quinquepunctata]